MMRSAILTVLLAMGGTAYAQEPPAAAPPATVAPPKAKSIVSDKDKLICRSVRVTGSYMPQRECMTKGERERRQAAVLTEAQKLQARTRPSTFVP